ncbi:biopolymer transport protein ExbB [Sinobacterium caligoides]|uniref:Biopolymer transport protein ExbB n=1 Tax=Sinobacterium caligoides TaxID=933926 RepID=A0A3N2DGC4_9GAMM|nr:MotA/TolQ/ExbB proton channel family protein [Sinobacterium caligoides]ROR98842.1 biopolymer transport protein ExbB [Sinobacterium caligoides]
MKLNTIKKTIAAVVGSAMLLGSAGSLAADLTLDQLLKKVESGRYAEAKENKAREARFSKEKQNQERLLAEMKAELARLEGVSQQREKQFEENEQRVAEAEKTYNERKGTLNELFGHLTSAAGDARSNFEVSLTSIQYPDRAEFLDGLVAKMSGSDELPTIAEIEKLWFELQREMVESGRVAKFDTTVKLPNGDAVDETVVRVGTFNVVSEDGKYLKYANGSLEELPRQPASAIRSQAAKAATSTSGLSAFGVDPTGPTGGSFLAALINSPSIEERWHQGGYVGYAISALGVVAFILAIWRLIVLVGVSGKVNAQLKSSEAKENNPLGRVLAVSKSNPNMDTETLELKLHEAVLKEIPSLENYQGALKIIAAVAPLMGLLGTVTGMILTFQAITIFGAGDPKAMAGGISSALITTVLGLVVAIPTVLLHTVVSSRSKRIIHILEEQTAGIIAEHTEAELRKG